MSKEEDTIDKGNKLGSFLDSWTKIIGLIIICVSSCAMAYYQIFENKDDIALEKRDRIEHEVSAEERGDKRYKEAMKIAEDLKDFIKYQEGRIIDLEKKESYMEGYEKGKEFNEKK